MQPDRRACFQSWAEELKSRSDRVRNLIGGAHWLSDGHHKEELVREFLIRHLPKRYRVSRGFICPVVQGETVSREIDILVTDSEADLPWFFEGGLAIVPPGSAVAQIHVKTRFATKELADVLCSGSYNDAVFQGALSNRSLWFGAIFFSSGEALGAEEMQSVWAAAVEKLHERNPTRLPDCIAILDGPAFLLKPSGGDDSVTIRAYDCGTASPAVFLSHLYDSVTMSGKDSTRRGEWFEMLSQVCNGPLYSQDIPLCST
jgi:hypothetical protein